MSIQKQPDWRDLRYLQFVTYRCNGSEDAEIATKLGFESPEVLYWRLKEDGYPVCPECGTAPATGEHCEFSKQQRFPGAGGGQRGELPPAVGAFKLFRERLEALLRDAESLASRVESYHDKLFAGTDVNPGVLAFLRYLTDGEGRRREMYSEEEWQELCERHDQPPDVEEIVIPDSVFQVPVGAGSAPPEPLTTLIGVYALAGGEMEALLEALYRGEPSNDIREEIRKCVEGKKKLDKKDGLKTLSRQLAVLVRGGNIQGAPPPALSSVMHDAACFITRIREEDCSEEEMVRRLSNHRKPDGSQLTKADIRQLGLLRLRYPQG